MLPAATPRTHETNKLIRKTNNDPLSLVITYHAPLLYAVRQKNIVILQLLLAHPAIDVNIGDAFGRTALSYATGTGFAEGVTLLLRHNADPFIDDFSGKNAFDYAATAVKKILNQSKSIKTTQEIEEEPAVEEIKKEVQTSVPMTTTGAVLASLSSVPIVPIPARLQKSEYQAIAACYQIAKQYLTIKINSTDSDFKAAPSRVLRCAQLFVLVELTQSLKNLSEDNPLFPKSCARRIRNVILHNARSCLGDVTEASNVSRSEDLNRRIQRLTITICSFLEGKYDAMPQKPQTPEEWLRNEPGSLYKSLIDHVIPTR